MKNTYHNLEGFKRKSLQMGSVLGIPIRDQFKDIVDAARVSQIHGKALHRRDVAACAAALGSVVGIPIGCYVAFRDQFKDIVEGCRDAARVSRNAARRAKRNAARRRTMSLFNRKELRCLGVARLELLYRICVVAFNGFRKCQMTIK